jgi:hypothetical protein
MYRDFATIRAQLLEKRRAVGDDIIASPPADYAALRDLTGYARGLLEAADLIENVLKTGDEI